MMRLSMASLSKHFSLSAQRHGAGGPHQEGSPRRLAPACVAFDGGSVICASICDRSWASVLCSMGAVEALPVTERLVLEAEAAIIGVVLGDAAVLERAVPPLRPAEFRHQLARRVLEAVHSLRSEKRAGDVEIIAARLGLSPVDRQGLIDWVRTSPSVANFGSYVAILRGRQAQERVQSVARGLVDATNSLRLVDVAKLARSASVELAEIAELSEPVADRFVAMRAREVLDVPPRKWLMDDYLPDRGLGVLYGAPGSGKTFLALDIAVAVARGATWFGKPTTCGAVVYVAAEGRLDLRLGAWLAAHLASPNELENFFVVYAAPDLLNEGDLTAMKNALRTVTESYGPIRLVVIDTLARCIPGADENSMDAMSGAVRACQEIERLIDGLVMLVHHSGKVLDRGPRGHSSLLGAADFVAAVEIKGKCRTVTITKQRDGEIGDRLEFVLRSVDLRDGRHSCVVEPPNAYRRPLQLNLSSANRIALDALLATVNESGERLPATSAFPSGVKGVQLSEWQRRFVTLYSERSAKPDSQRRAWRRVRDELMKGGLVGIFESWAWPCS